MREWKKRTYQYFYGSCMGLLVFILILTSNYVGSSYLILIIWDLAVLFYSSWYFKKKSDELTMHFLTLRRDSGRPHMVQGKRKKFKITLKHIFYQRVSIGLLIFAFYFAIGIFFSLIIFFHEIGHLLTAMSLNVQIGVFFISPLRGFVEIIDLMNINIMKFNIIGFSGGLGVIIIGTILLLLLHWNDEITLTFKIPLTSILLYAICSNLTYFWDGALSLPNDTDIGLILQRNPNLNPSFILYFSLLWFLLIIIFSLSVITKELVNKTKVVLNIIYPDVSPFSYKI